MALVVDASVALAWCFPDEADAYADAVLTALEDDSAVAPGIWALEVANGLATGLLRGRIGPAEVSGAQQILEDLNVALRPWDLPEAIGPILALASRHGLTTSDASYLHLALREGLPLATIDDRLRAAARAAGCSVFEPPA